MKNIRLVMLASAVALAASTTFAQSGAGTATGAGAVAPGAQPGASAPAPGMGKGKQAGRGPAGRSGSDFTPGWSMMTQQERNEHHERMRSAKTGEECKAYLEQHRAQMAQRAKERGGKALGQTRRDACAEFKP